MIPYQGGGDMIKFVTFDKIIFNDLPFKFEAGTPNIAGAIGLGAALDYLNEIDFQQALKYEDELGQYFYQKLLQIPEVRLLGQAEKRVPVFSFVIDGVHPHDIASFFDAEGIAIRTGHHCTQPLMQFYKVPATSRASISFYNTYQEVDYFIKVLKDVIKFFK